MITLCIINRLRIRMNWRSISRSKLCDIIQNAFDIVWVKTCMFYCNPLLVSLKKLSCLSNYSLRKSWSDSCEDFLPLWTGIFWSIFYHFYLPAFLSYAPLMIYLAGYPLPSLCDFWLMIPQLTKMYWEKIKILHMIIWNCVF